MKEQYSEKTRIVEKKKRKGVAGDVGKFFNSFIKNDIGKEVVEKVEIYYRANENIKDNCLKSTKDVFESALIKLQKQMDKLEKSYLLAFEGIENKVNAKQREQARTITEIYLEISKREQEKSKVKEIINGFEKIRLDLDLLSQDIKKV